MAQKIVDELIALVVREMKLDPAKVKGDTPLFEGGLELDSFAVVDLIMRIEGQFSIQLADTDFAPENFQDFNSMANLVARYHATAAAKSA